ncbi:putative dehydrogenase [Sediminihabitans luteus]|uniref:Putative dehydrogenase n=1 Tax=Sediminihabitans luteus TaxID=1138585 RepID=A0A2M9D052_9CELL|nr:Gfo/Idh/MocA family oxidoreductase [Sediminihabitans luteus]PJJ77517.1 putative dehydrogenase [Sediminihabitans luteus]GII98416.1 oxidoreductase [Sediminihabitans luteus]
MTAVSVLDAAPDPMFAPAIRWGILGPGSIARSFAEAVRTSTRGRVTAVGSRDVGRAQDLAERHTDDARAHGSYEDLVGDPDVDVVYVATPHSHHREHALLAIAAGKHVLVEKAFTRNAAEARDVLDAARAAGVFVMEALKTRHLPHVAAIRTMIARGEIGDVVSVTGSYEAAFPHDPSSRIFDPALAGGALLDIGVYPIGFAMDLLGVPDDVRATGFLTATGVDAQANVALRYGTRAVASLTTSVLARTPVSLTIGGTGGFVHLPSHFSAPAGFVVEWADGARKEFDGFVPDGKQYEAAEVARCVAEGRTESDRMTWQDTLDLMAVLDAARAQLGVVYPGE